MTVVGVPPAAASAAVVIVALGVSALLVGKTISLIRASSPKYNET
jgi:hypothetical protein